MTATRKVNWRIFSGRKFPWYLLLLPLFFVLHGWKENFYDVSAAQLAPLAAVYLLAAIILFILSLAVFRDVRRAGFFAFTLLAINFFFGAVQDTLSASVPVLSHYSVLLTAIAVLLIVLVIWLKRTGRQLTRLTFFLNVLLVIFLIIDLGSLLFMPPQDPNRFSANGQHIKFSPCRSCPKPDVYFLLCDEFASTASLKETWHYDNSWFDSTLAGQGFQVMASSSSNYNFTPFSMASILNMDYLQGIRATDAMTQDDYQRCNSLIKRNSVVSFFRSAGYEIKNYSVFDLEGLPSPLHQTFLPLKTRPITQQTLLNRLKRDLGHVLITGRWRVGWIADLIYEGPKYNSFELLSRVVDESAMHSKVPRFFYTHLFIPHTPYLYDSAGKQRSDSLILSDYKTPSVNAYLESVAYGSRRLAGAVDSIVRQSAQPPIIILIGDHGFRMKDPATGRQDVFRNMNAVYLPPGVRAAFPDTMTTVNQFRILLNRVYGQQLPLLKDSTILLTDK